MASISGATNSLGNTTLRGYGGLSSGIDRDSIIEQMTLKTQTKITSQQKSMTSLGWKQEAYRSVSGKILDLQDNYFSYSSGFNLKDASVFAKNRVSVLGNSDATKFVSASGSSNMINYLSLLGVKQTASSTTLLSAGKGTASIKTGITADSLTNEVYKTSNLEGAKLEFGVYGTDGKFRTAGTFTFPASYKEKDANGKDVTVTLDYTSDMDAVNSKTGKTFGTELAEGLNKALAQSNIKSGDAKLSEVAEFKYEIVDGKGVMKFQEKAGKKTDLAIRSTSSALTALGYNKVYEDGTEKDTTRGISLEMLGKNQKKFVETYAKSQNMVDFLKGKKLSVSFGGQTKQIELVKSGDTINNLDDLKKNIQERLDQAFGSGNIAVKKNGSSLEFDVGDNASSNQTLTITSSDADVRRVLDIGKGASNKLSTESSIRDNIDKLLPDATEEQKDAFIADLNTNGLKINGVTIKGVTADTTISSMMDKINANEEAGVKVSYLSGSNQFVMITSETGKGRQITLDGASKTLFGAKIKKVNGSEAYVDSSFKKVDGQTWVGGSSLEDGKNAEVLVSYGNGIKTLVESSSNTFDLDGMKVTVSGTFGDVKKDGSSWTSDSSMAVTFSSEADVDGVTEQVKKFFEEYNAMITEVNTQITTRPDSSYGPLTDAQKAEMTETSIENWEKKAKQGILFNDATMRSLSSDLQSVMTKMLSSGISYQDLEEMGITMSDDYLDGGTISFNEEKFKTAMASDPDKVAEVFAGNGTSKGLTEIVEDTLIGYACRYRSQNGDSYGRLIEEAGSEKLPLSVMDNQIYKQLKEMETLLDKYRTQLSTEQDRYIKQFTTMETLINKMNSQSSYLSQLS